MKRFISATIIMFTLILAACGSQSGTNDQSAKFNAQLFVAVKSYLELKNALVAGDAETAAEKAQAFETALAAIDEKAVPQDLAAGWKIQRESLASAIDSLNASQDIMDQRLAFYYLSEALIKVVKNHGPLDMPLYVQHCPMAFDYTGGDWLSDSKEVFNPYFGNMMLRCGSVTEELAKK